MIIERPLLIVNLTKSVKEIEKTILKYYPNALNEENPDVIFSVGGDGTFLHTVKNQGYRNVPIFGIAKGTLNFIPSHENDWDSYFKKLSLKEVELEMESTFYINIEIEKSTGEKEIHKAVNDIVLGNGIMDYFHFLLNSEDSNFSDYTVSSGGLCISSPLGSTAYNYNNGGVVIPSLNLPLLAVSSIVSNRMEAINKPISSNQVLNIEINPNKESRDNCLLFIDGKTKILEFHPGDKIKISQGEKISLLFTSLKTFEIKRLTF